MNSPRHLRNVPYEINRLSLVNRRLAAASFGETAIRDCGTSTADGVRITLADRQSASKTDLWRGLAKRCQANARPMVGPRDRSKTELSFLGSDSIHAADYLPFLFFPCHSYRDGVSRICRLRRAGER